MLKAIDSLGPQSIHFANVQRMSETDASVTVDSCYDILIIDNR